jgi:hypothetical protein
MARNSMTSARLRAIFSTRRSPASKRPMRFCWSASIRVSKRRWSMPAFRKTWLAKRIKVAGMIGAQVDLNYPVKYLGRRCRKALERTGRRQGRFRDVLSNSAEPDDYSGAARWHAATARMAVLSKASPARLPRNTTWSSRLERIQHAAHGGKPRRRAGCWALPAASSSPAFKMLSTGAQ